MDTDQKRFTRKLLSRIAFQFKDSKNFRVEVVDLTSGSPALAVGIQLGDIIL